MTYKGFLGHLRGYRQQSYRGDTPGGKYAHPNHWVLEVFAKTDEVSVSGIAIPEKKRKPRKRKLDTPEDIERVCFLYYMTDTNIAQIGVHFDVSPVTANRVIKEHGTAYCQKNKEDIAKRRKER